MVDPGTARVNRWSHRHKVQRLHVEPVSQASADQRKGRCGRVSDGVCIRLYSEQDYLDLEREVFLSLCGERKTVERIQHMLKKGKPLRN